MRNLTELNINRGGGPVGRAAPSDRVIQAFEQQFGLKLPAAYLALLRHSNGGHPELSSIKRIDRAGFSGWGVSRFYYLDDDKNSVESLWRRTEWLQQILGKEILPFANDGFDNQFFLDFRTDPPAVRVWVHDEEGRVDELAPHFEAFVDLLDRDPELI